MRPAVYVVPGGPVHGPGVKLMHRRWTISRQTAEQPALNVLCRQLLLVGLMKACASRGLVLLSDVTCMSTCTGDDFIANRVTMSAEVWALDLRRQLDWPPFDPFPRLTRLAAFLRRVYDSPSEAGYRAAIRLRTWMETR